MLEDVYVLPWAAPSSPTRASRHPRLWLICDEDMVECYRRRGFTSMRPEELPPSLAALYEAKGEFCRAASTFP